MHEPSSPSSVACHTPEEATKKKYLSLAPVQKIPEDERCAFFFPSLLHLNKNKAIWF
jgi:hypothetical protein